MKKTVYALSMLLGIWGGSLQADFPGIENWRVSADFLYLVPTIDDTHFVTTNPVVTTIPWGSRKGNDLFFKPGFRVGVGVDFCDSGANANIAYTWLHATKRKSISGPSLSALQGSAFLTSTFSGYVGSASSYLNTLYERVDALVLQQALCGCGWDINVQFGFEYAYLRLREHYVYQSATAIGRVEQLTKTFAFGPEAGLGFTYKLADFQCLGGTLALEGFSSMSVLSGQTRNSNLQRIGTELNLDINDRRAWRIIPALHARFGVSYIMQIFRCPTLFSVGYEWNSYIRGMSRILYPENSSSARQSFTNYYDFDVQGLYVSVSSAF